MDIEAYNNHCLAQEKATEELPFGEKTLVDNVIGKIACPSIYRYFRNNQSQVYPRNSHTAQRVIYRGSSWLSHEQGSVEYSTHRWEYS